jgi:hypothetical protein
MCCLPPLKRALHFFLIRAHTLYLGDLQEMPRFTKKRFTTKAEAHNAQTAWAAHATSNSSTATGLIHRAVRAAKSAVSWSASKIQGSRRSERFIGYAGDVGEPDPTNLGVFVEGASAPSTLKRKRDMVAATAPARTQLSVMVAARKFLKEGLELVRNPFGRRRTYHENCTIMHVVFTLKQDHLEAHGSEMSDTAAANEAARLTGARNVGGVASVLELIKEYNLTGSIVTTEWLESRGRDYTKARHLKPRHVSQIDKFIEDSAKKGDTVTIPSIMAHLAEDTEATELLPAFPGIKVTSNVVRNALIKYLGYEYGKIQGKAIERDLKRPNIIRQYAMDLSDALKLEAASTHVIVYVDESYIHEFIAAQFGWIKGKSAGGTGRINRKAAKGAGAPRAPTRARSSAYSLFFFVRPAYLHRACDYQGRTSLLGHQGRRSLCAIVRRLLAEAAAVGRRRAHGRVHLPREVQHERLPRLDEQPELPELGRHSPAPNVRGHVLHRPRQNEAQEDDSRARQRPIPPQHRASAADKPQQA